MDRCNGNNLLDEQCYLPLDRCNGKRSHDVQSYLHLVKELFFLMYQLFVIFYYSGVYFVNIFKPLRLILVKNEVQYLNEKFGTHEMF